MCAANPALIRSRFSSDTLGLVCAAELRHFGLTLVPGFLKDRRNVGVGDEVLKAFRSPVEEGVVWHLPGRSSMANDYQGREATLAYFGQLAQETGGTFQAELERLLGDDDDRVVGIHRSTAERDGKHLDVGDSIVFQLKDGRIIDGREHFHDLYAWDEFWS